MMTDVECKKLRAVEQERLETLFEQKKLARINAIEALMGGSA